MKKIIAIVMVFLYFIPWAFAYSPNSVDIEFLNNLYLKIDNIWDKKINDLKFLWNKVEIYKNKYKSNDRLYFLFSEISNYIISKTTVYNVLKVVDWDTIQIYYDWKLSSIRFIWIDSPESYTKRFGYKECFWEEASKYLKNLIEWKNITLEFDETQWKVDKYNRYLAYIFLDWKNVNEEMIKNGYAWEYTYSTKYKYQESFKNSQKLSSENKYWLWALNSCNWERKKVEEIISNSWAIANTWAINLNNNIIIEKPKIDLPKIENISNYTCWTKTYCTQMSTCEEAKFFLNSCWLTRLDSDKDWILCESLCN